MTHKMTAPDSGNGWNESSRLVMAELRRLDKTTGKIIKEVQGCRIDIATLKVKSGVWGAVAGAIPATIALLIMYLR